MIKKISGYTMGLLGLYLLIACIIGVNKTNEMLISFLKGLLSLF